MSRTCMGVVVVFMVLAVAVSASAGIPDADASFITMTNGGKGLTTCPSGDGGGYNFVTVTALRADFSPIQGIPSGSFFFTFTGSGSGNAGAYAFDAETDVNGEIRFQVEAYPVIVHGSLDIEVQIYTIVLTDTATLWCNTYDYDESGGVDPIDFAVFAGDFVVYNERSDFDWNGTVDPVDFAYFAAHFGH